MLKYFSKAFRITNENIILTTPLVLFLFLLSIYLGVIQNAPRTIFSGVLLLVTILFMISAFFAGWFFMVKRAIDLENLKFEEEEEKARASFNLLKEIPPGVGEFFIPFVIGTIFYSTLTILIFAAAYKFGNHFIGDVGLSQAQLKMLVTTPEAMKEIVSALSREQLAKLNLWNLMFLSVAIGYSFITMFWASEIVLRTKNVFLALFKSINFILRNFLNAIILFLYVSFVNFLISFINAIATINPILYFISMLAYFYFIVYIVVLIFLYYAETIYPKYD